LTGLPLKDADISEFDFSGSDLRGTGLRHTKRSDGAIISNGTKLDPADRKWWSRRKPAPWYHLMERASELIDRGETLGDSALLEEAIALCNEALTLVPRRRFPAEWAGTKHNLGLALQALGERQSGTARLEGAVAAYREALQENTRARVPLNWAATQNNLGNALRMLGQREPGTARLEEAVAALRDALKERTRERVPLDWASTQMNLGGALQRLGEQGSRTEELQEAVSAYNEALKEITRERAPLVRASILVGLGNTLRILADRERFTPGLEELRLHSGSNFGFPRGVHSVDEWYAFMYREERRRRGARLDEALTALREGLQEYARERLPLVWAGTQENVALVYRALYNNDGQPSHLDAALEAVDGALEEYRKTNSTYYIENAERLRQQILAARGKL
jgi:tetratricopeptide (TPR) repeat protein